MLDPSKFGCDRVMSKVWFEERSCLVYQIDSEANETIQSTAS